MYVSSDVYDANADHNVRCILVLLVFRNKILHVRLCFCELEHKRLLVILPRLIRNSTHLHLVHTLLGVPMQESLPLEHGSELVAHTLEELLNGG